MSVDADADMEGLFAGEREDDRAMFGDEDDEERGGFGADEAIEVPERGAASQMNATANLDIGEKKRRVQRNPQPKLNADRLMGPRGIQTLEDVFKDWEPRGAGHEFDDLEAVMLKMNHWAHRLFPKLPFDGTLDIIANRLGKSKVVSTHVKKIRMGMVTAQPVLRDDHVAEEEDDREVARYGGGDEDEGEDVQDVIQQLAGGAGNQQQQQQQPKPQQVGGGGLSEDQMERMRRNRELAAHKKREREEQRRREQEEEELMRDMDQDALEDMDTVNERVQQQSSLQSNSQDESKTNSGDVPANESSQNKSPAKTDENPQDIEENPSASTSENPADSQTSAAAAAEWGGENPAKSPSPERGEKSKSEGETAQGGILSVDEMMEEMDAE